MTRCAIPDCNQPANTACTMSGCPGRSFNCRASGAAPARARGKEAGVFPASASTTVPADPHGRAYTGFSL